MMKTMEPHGRGMAADILALELANAKQRINRTEFAIERTEEMLAENIALCSRIRTARRRVAEAAERLV